MKKIISGLLVAAAVVAIYFAFVILIGPLVQNYVVPFIRPLFEITPDFVAPTSATNFFLSFFLKFSLFIILFWVALKILGKILEYAVKKLRR